MPSSGTLQCFLDCFQNQNQALILINSKLYKQAITLLQSILNVNSQYSHAYYLLAFCHYKNNSSFSKKLMKRYKNYCQKLNKGCNFFNWQFQSEDCLSKLKTNFQKIKNKIFSLQELQQLTNKNVNTRCGDILSIYNHSEDFNTGALFIEAFLHDNNSFLITSSKNSELGQIFEISKEIIPIQIQLSVEITLALYHGGKYNQLLTFFKSHNYKQFEVEPRRYTNRSALLILTQRFQHVPFQLQICKKINPNFKRIGFIQCQFYICSQGNYNKALEELIKAINLAPKALTYQLQMVMTGLLVLLQEQPNDIPPIKVAIEPYIKTCEDIMQNNLDQQFGFIPSSLYSDVKKFLKVLKRFLNLQNQKTSEQLVRRVKQSLKNFQKLFIFGMQDKRKSLQRIENMSEEIVQMMGNE